MKRDEKEINQSLGGLIETLKTEAIDAGKQAADQIIADAQEKSDQIISDAQKRAQQIIVGAQENATQIEKNGLAALEQSSRDVVEATRVASQNFLKFVFGKHCETLFGEQKYFETLLGAVLGSLPGQKTVQISSALLEGCEQFLLASAFADEVTLKPLPRADAKIVITCTEKAGVQFELTAADVQNALFSLLNPDLVARIAKPVEG